MPTRSYATSDRRAGASQRGLQAPITLAIDPEQRTLAVEDNGIGMSRDEMVEALGTIACSVTGAFLERIVAAKGNEQAPDRPVRHRVLLGLHGGGPHRRVLAPRRDRAGHPVVLGRQRHLHSRCDKTAFPPQPRTGMSATSSWLNVLTAARSGGRAFKRIDAAGTNREPSRPFPHRRAADGKARRAD
jgi:hypothetical protein